MIKFLGIAIFIGVYVDLSGLPDYMENVEMEEGGSPYGNFISDKKTIEEEKIDVNYTLKVKINIVIILILCSIFIVLLFYLNYKLDKYTILIVFLLMIILTIILNKYLFLDSQLWAEDGKVFLQEYIDNGFISLFNSYAGYYHLLPRIITIISLNLSILFIGIITYSPLFMYMLYMFR